jgi:ribosomal protein L11 methyltransferase
MFVWRKRASARWLAANEGELRRIAGDQLAVIETGSGKTATAEVADNDRRRLERVRRRFGGRITTLPRYWLRNFSRLSAKRSLRIGKRLRIVQRRMQLRESDPALIIPAGAAFGTGDHATTAMSLNLLERISRMLAPGWSLIDLGTGTGVLALAAKRFGAGKVCAIDLDPTAISTAKENARLNKILGIEFRVSDVRTVTTAQKFDIVSANLFSDLLIEISPRVARMLKGGGFAILSGILHNQERDLRRGFRGVPLRLLDIRRRGKWNTLLASKTNLTTRKRASTLKVSGDFDPPALGRRGPPGGSCRPKNFPTPSSRPTRCANRAPAGLCPA